MKNKNIKGFTLLELSIVMIIIGILLIGMFKGAELVKAARVSADIKYIGNIQTAFVLFKDKYGKYPGDFHNASTQIGSAMVNGNGDNIINTHHVYTPTEYLQVMQHLAGSKMIKGTFYPGWAYSGGFPNALWPGYNILPMNKSKMGMMVMGTRPSLPEWQGEFAPPITTIKSGNYLQIGAIATDTYDDFLWGAGYTSAEAYKMDIKLDDGKPITGLYLATHGNQSLANRYGTCFDPPSPVTTDAKYILNTEDTGCRVYFALD